MKQKVAIIKFAEGISDKFIAGDDNIHTIMSNRFEQQLATEPRRPQILSLRKQQLKEKKS